MKSKPIDAYEQALRTGQKYYKEAVSRGEYPYPPALDYILDPATAAGYVDLGLVNIPAELICGTKTLGRSPALAGNFMPLMGERTEFGDKWMKLYACQMGDEGIRDPIKCYEYLGRFYVEEGNKRVSVLKSVEAPSIPGRVTRVVPPYTDDPARKRYYEFMQFYALSGMYGVEFHGTGNYARLQAALGFEPDHVWTEEERLSFSAGYARFRTAFGKLNRQGVEATPAEALLTWLQIYSFDDIKSLSAEELQKRLQAIWPDVAVLAAPDPIALNTAPQAKPEESRGLLDRLLSMVKTEHLNVAFIYGYAPERHSWSQAHELGRVYIQERMGSRVTARAYVAKPGECAAALERAVSDGAEVVFATLSEMTGDCRRAAARYENVKFLVCGLSQPYTGVRFYFSRIYEAKFLSGAVTGALAREDEVGYIANMPIVGVPAEINAFALGMRMTNPQAKVRLAWACVPGDPMEEFRERGIRFVSNRLTGRPDGRTAYSHGTWRMENGIAIPLTHIIWHWGKLYEQIILSIFSGTWDAVGGGKAVNYWWGMDSGVIELKLEENLPEGVRYLGDVLKKDLISRTISPFRCHIEDRDRILRNDGSEDFTPEQMMSMDWFCDNVVGGIPPYEALLPTCQRQVRLLGLYRQHLPPTPEDGGV